VRHERARHDPATRLGQRLTSQSFIRNGGWRLPRPHPARLGRWPGAGGLQLQVGHHFRNRFGASGAEADLDVVSVAAALSGGPAVVGHVRAGLFPRAMTVAPDGTLLVSDFSSGQLEAVALGS